MININKINENVKKGKNWIIESCIRCIRQPTRLYIFTLIILLMGKILEEFGILSSERLRIIVYLMLLGALIYDLIYLYILKKEEILGKFLFLLYSLILYFIWIKSDSMAYIIITETTGEKADYFPIASNFFQAIYLPYAFIFMIITNPICIIFGMCIFLVAVLGIVIGKKWVNFFKHLVLFIFTSFLILWVAIFPNIDKKYEDLFGRNYIPKKIIEYSYHKNTNCEDVEGYIHFLYKDVISVTNVKDLKYTNGLSVKFVSPKDTNITFSTQKCIRKQKVSML